jgi:hypothetical protein
VYFILLPQGRSFLFTTKSTQGISLIYADNKQSAIRLKTTKENVAQIAKVRQLSGMR